MSGRSLYRTADDDPVLRAMDQQFDFRGAAFREIDRLVASGIERGAAIRWIEDVNHMKRGALTAYLER